MHRLKLADVCHLGQNRPHIWSAVHVQCFRTSDFIGGIFYFFICDGGVSNARNMGIDASHGKYITFLDSDDFFINNKKIQNEIECIEKSEGAILAFSKIVYVNSIGNKIDSFYQKDGEYYSGSILEQVIIGINPYVIPRDYCIEKKYLNIAGRYDTGMKLYEDLELLLRILSNCSAVCTLEDGTAYRLNTGGLSNQSEKKCQRTKWYVLWNATRYCKGNKMLIRIRLIVRRACFECKLIMKWLMTKGE